MAATCVATLNLSTLPPQVLIDVTGFTGPTITIVRYDASGAGTPVRASPAPLIGGAATVFDVEEPFGVLVDYAATDGTSYVVSAPVLMPVTQAWLIHPGVPVLSQPIEILSGGAFDLTMVSSTALHQVLGRATPIPISDGQRKAPTTAMTLYTDDPVSEAGLLALFDDDSPLLLQVPSPTGASAPLYYWVSVGDVVDARVDQDQDAPWREWGPLTLTVVDRPAGPVSNPRTFATETAEFATWADEIAGPYVTYRGLLTGVAGT